MSTLPHAIVAIDLGTEFTKVCYAFRNGERASYGTTMIASWDAKESIFILPTAVTRDGQVSTCGWQALTEGEITLFARTFIAFKLCLLKGSPRVFAVGDTALARPVSLMEIMVDYFQHIIRRLKELTQVRLMEQHSVTWDKAIIHIVLSMPVIDGEERRSRYSKSLESALLIAGFCGPNHHIVGDMPEPKAAARYSLGHPTKEVDRGYRDGEVCILVDVGGGTADICAFRIEDVASCTVVPIGTTPIRGVNIGGTMVNRSLETILINYLLGYRDLLLDGIVPADAARLLAWGQGAGDVKIRAGGVVFATDRDTTWPLHSTVKVISGAPSCPEENGISLQSGKICVDLAHLTTFFDYQMEGSGKAGSRGIWGLIGTIIDNVFVSAHKVRPRLSDAELKDEMRKKEFHLQLPEPVKIDHLILTGGFGAQPYVRASLERLVIRDSQVEASKHTGGCKYTNLAGVSIKEPDKPQLCVSVGLLEAYVAQIVVSASDQKPGLFASWLRVFRHKSK